MIDAHERFPIERARIAIEHVSFGVAGNSRERFHGREGSISHRSSAEDGNARALFCGLATSRPHARESRSAARHRCAAACDAEEKLPPSGEIEIALVSRKRAILDRLVEWARMRGKPYDARPEPTPAHVQRAAAGKSGDIVAWAEAIERAAYDDGDVDARVEQEIDAIAPKNEALPRPRS